MAGSYSDVPDHRMAYDRDGTTVFTGSVGAGFTTQLTSGQVTSLNKEVYEANGVIGTTVGVLFVFPELRDLTAATCVIDSVRWEAWTVMTSADSTDGVDGTWTTAIASGTSSSTTNGRFQARTNIRSGSATGVKMVRFLNNDQGSGNGAAIHLYGKIATGENPDRLEFWHPTTDTRLGPAALDWGNAPRSSTADLTFRVKNLSASLTASSVTVSMGALTDTSPTVVGQHTVSADGTTFGATCSAGTLAPGAISGTLTLRRTLSSTAVLGPWQMRLIAEATGGWA